MKLIKTTLSTIALSALALSAFASGPSTNELTPGIRLAAPIPTSNTFYAKSNFKYEQNGRVIASHDTTAYPLFKNEIQFPPKKTISNQYNVPLNSYKNSTLYLTETIYLPTPLGNTTMCTRKLEFIYNNKGNLKRIPIWPINPCETI